MKVEFVPTCIAKVTENGVVLEDGTCQDLDIIVCATGELYSLAYPVTPSHGLLGFDTSFHYPFEVIGRGGKTLRQRYTPYPETYLSLCTDGFPNWFMAFGPNSAFGTGSFIPVLEAQVDYAIKVAKKLQKEHYKSIEPKRQAVADFDEYLEVGSDSGPCVLPKLIINPRNI